MIRNLELKRQSDRILSLIDDAERLLADEEEMQAHLAKYICILCSGFLENVVKVLYSEHIKSITQEQSIISYIISNLNSINNPNTDRLRGIAKSFNPVWEIELNAFMVIDSRSTIINYIMRERHSIAHGKDSEITLLRIREYHLKSLEVAEFIENQCTIIVTTPDVPVTP